jgi:hypothetical protein
MLQPSYEIRDFGMPKIKVIHPHRQNVGHYCIKVPQPKIQPDRLKHSSKILPQQSALGFLLQLKYLRFPYREDLVYLQLDDQYIPQSTPVGL